MSGGHLDQAPLTADLILEKAKGKQLMCNNGWMHMTSTAKGLIRPGTSRNHWATDGKMPGIHGHQRFGELPQKVWSLSKPRLLCGELMDLRDW